MTTLSEIDSATTDPRRSLRAAVLQAARKLLVDEGPHALTVDGVVAASGVAKTTIYRHWPSQRDLLVAVMRDCRPDLEAMVSAADADDFETALRRLTASIVAMFEDEEWRRVMPAMMMLKRQLKGVEEVQEDMRRENLAAVADIVDLGIAEGKLRADTDAHRMMMIIGGPLMMAALLDEPMPPGLADELVDRFLASERALMAAD